jgi:hypothetical protein
MAHLNDSGIDNGRDEQVPVASSSRRGPPATTSPSSPRNRRHPLARPAHIAVLAHSAQSDD